MDMETKLLLLEQEVASIKSHAQILEKRMGVIQNRVLQNTVLCNNLIYENEANVGHKLRFRDRNVKSDV